MKPGQATPLLRHLRELAAAQGAGQLADRQLLEHFTHHHDEAAFAALVRRHGPLVLGVCRRVLGHEQDAEDAFQAAFLVLAKKAGAIRQGESLGAWLYQVAYRLALRARVHAARRQARERQAAADRPAPDPLDEVTGRELLAALDEELQHLPERYRTPLVLCYLQGKTRDEAAGQLGWSLGTLKRRLEQGRQRLRSRLERRGLALPGALLPTGLVPGTPTVPPEWVAATTRGALAVATDPAAAIPAPVAALMKQGLRTLFVNHLKGTAAVGLALGLLAAGAGAVTYQALALHQPPRPDATPAAERPQPIQPVADKGQEQAVAGIVREASGRPLAGATVCWLGAPPVQSANALPRTQSGIAELTLLARGRTDADGRFTLHARFKPGRYAITEVVAQAPGFGLAGRLCRDTTAPVHLTLQPEVPIKGRLVTLSGAPVRGARVRLQDVGSLNQTDLEQFWGVTVPDGPQGARALGLTWPEPVRTDEQGRFTLGGVGKEAVAGLEVSHPDSTREVLRVSTATGPANRGRTFGQDLLETSFTHTLEPGRIVRGVVTDGATGKPLAGVFVQVSRVPMGGGSARTDREGRYRIERLTGSPGEGWFFSAIPDPGSGYLVQVENRPGGPGRDKVLEMNFALRKGCRIRGRVLDAATRRPIAGVSVVYEIKRGNPNARAGDDFRNPVLSDAQGRFGLTGLPGKGMLLAATTGADYVHAPWPPQEEAGGIDRRLREEFPHAYVDLNLPAGKDASVDLFLRKGVALPLRVVRPDGRPAARVFALCPDLGLTGTRNYNEPSPFQDGLARLPGCDPKRTYRMFFLEPDLHLGGVADVRADPAAKEPVEVRLQPTASVHLKVLGADGTPARDAQILAVIWLPREPGRLTRGVYLAGERVALHVALEGPGRLVQAINRRPDAGGVIMFDNLVPGVPLYFWAAERATQNYGFVGATLKPGEVRDLGVLKVNRSDRPGVPPQ